YGTGRRQQGWPSGLRGHPRADHPCGAVDYGEIFDERMKSSLKKPLQGAILSALFRIVRTRRTYRTDFSGISRTSKM
ncbi:MAG TPA: hypothetical protein VEY51_03425, partial [Chondromyces sp.]|nr:hypothetical protein [Chondromyces sp.]